VLNSTGHVELHIKESNHIRDFVFGFGDGLNTSGIVACVGGANSSTDFIILAALVGMFTGAMAMAVQNYLAVWNCLIRIWYWSGFEQRKFAKLLTQKA
jgi:hypothetical protein